MTVYYTKYYRVYGIGPSSNIQTQHIFLKHGHCYDSFSRGKREQAENLLTNICLSSVSTVLWITLFIKVRRTHILENNFNS
jgi:hypothetical protein